MSLPPYVPPTKEQWDEVHGRLSWYIEAYERLCRATDTDGPSFTSPFYHDNMVARIKAMAARLEHLDKAIGR